jgi:MFS family permease
MAAVLFHFQLTSGTTVIATILFFIFCYAFSLGPVQWVIMSEIYPNQIRGRAMTIATMSLWIAAAIVAQVFPWMLENIHAEGTFLFFAVCSVGTIVLTILLIPETKNKSLEEIEEFWKRPVLN